MLMLERLELRALVRLADPSRVRSAAESTCTFPGILSMSMVVPGIAVAVTTTACNFSEPLASLWFDGLRRGIYRVVCARGRTLIESPIAQHGRIAAKRSRVTGKPPRIISMLNAVSTNAMRFEPERDSRSYRELFPTPVISRTRGGVMREPPMQSQLSHLTQESPWRDIAVVIGITALSLILSVHFNLNEALYAFTRRERTLSDRRTADRHAGAVDLPDVVVVAPLCACSP